MIFLDFIYQLRDEGLPIGMQEVLDFYKGLEKGLVEDLDALLLFARLVFVKRMEHLDTFERVFARYFFNIDLPPVAEGDPELFQTKQFRDWLAEAVERGEIPRHAYWHMSRDELMKRFWDRVREQMEAHHGGNKWVGTGGTSPFGHSGFASRGVRVFGGGRNRSAIKVIGERRHIAYSDANTLKGENIRQVLGSLRHMVPVGPETDLDLDDTIYRTSKNGGEIDLVFKRHERDRIKLVVLIDNGGTSMLPHVHLTRLLFSKIRDRFKDSRIYYFHNTIYNHVYKDSRRTEPLPVKELLKESPETRLFVVGDASMAPEELMYSYGAIDYEREDNVPSIARLEALRKRFRYSVWLNPIPKDHWDLVHGNYTINEIRGVFHMEDMTLKGIKKAVSYLREQVSA